MTLYHLIAHGESEILEFKSSFAKDVVETLCAFANHRGGTVLIGVNDEGKIVGATCGKESLQTWTNEIKQSTAPSIVPDMEIVQADGTCVVLIKVGEFPVKPVAYKGRYYKRVKNANHQLSVQEVVDCHLRTMNSSWDYYVDPQHGISDISMEKVGAFIALLNRNRPIAVTDAPMDVLRKTDRHHVQRGGDH